MASPVAPCIPQLPPNFALIAGPQMFGVLFSWALQGVLSVQVYIYHLYFPKDRIIIKLMVYGILIWEWVQTILVTQGGFDINVTHYGDISSVTGYHNTWFSVAIMSAVVSFVVQIYFAWRIWIISSSRILVGVIALLSLAQMVLGMTGGIILRIIMTNVDAAQASMNRPVSAASLIIATVVDIIIAVTMTFLLLRSKTGLHHSDGIVDRIVQLVIETGALTASIALIYAVLFLVETDNLLFECPALILPKVYSNSLVVSLNNRAFVRRSGDTRGPTTVSLSESTGSVIRSRALVPQDGSGRVRQRELHIEVVEDKYVTRDDLPSKAAVELVQMRPDSEGHGRAYGDMYKV